MVNVNPVMEGGELYKEYLDPVRIVRVSVWGTDEIVVVDLTLSRNPGAQFFLPKRTRRSLVYS